MDKKLRVAIISVGHFHAGIYLDFVKEKGYKIVALSDWEEEVAKRKAEELHCHFYKDYRQLLKKEEVDFVFSFGRHSEMAEIVDTILEEGISLCTEKPITNDAEVMRKLAEKAKQKNVFTDVALPYRFSPPILALNELKEKKDIGEVVHCYLRTLAGPLQRYVDWSNAWMINYKTALGGPFMNEGAHFIDLFYYLTKKEVKWVYASMNNHLYGKTIEDNFSTILETAEGERGVIELGYSYPTAKNWHEFAYLINTTNYLFTFIDREKPRQSELEVRCRKDNGLEVINLLKYNQEFYSLYLEEMLKRYLSGLPGVVPFEDYYRTVKVLEASYQSARSKKVVEIGNALTTD